MKFYSASLKKDSSFTISKDKKILDFKARQKRG